MHRLNTHTTARNPKVTQTLHGQYVQHGFRGNTVLLGLPICLPHGQYRYTFGAIETVHFILQVERTYDARSEWNVEYGADVKLILRAIRS